MSDSPMQSFSDVAGRHEPTEAQINATAVRAEMNALAAIVAGFEAMPDEARGRTLRYLADRYGTPPGKLMRPPAAPRPSERA